MAGRSGPRRSEGPHSQEARREPLLTRGGHGGHGFMEIELNQGTLSELIGRELHRFGLVIRFEEMSDSARTTLADVAQGVLDALKARGYRLIKDPPDAVSKD